MISAIPFSTILINYVTTQTHSPTITLRLDRSEHGRGLIHAVYAKKQNNNYKQPPAYSSAGRAKNSYNN